MGRDGQAVIEPGIAQCLQVGEGRIRSALEQLALAAHDRQGGAGTEDGEAADVTEGEVLVAFKPLLGTLAPEVLVAYLDQRAGLLILRRPGIYAFPHRSYQEFLAACQLSNQPGFAAALRERLRTDPKWWREVLLLGAGRIKRGGLGNVVALLNELLPEGPGDVPDRTDLHWQLASLTGQAMVETRLAEDAMGQPASEALLRRCRQWLVDLVEGGHLPPRDRAEAGDNLGQLGDPRFDPALFYLPAHFRGQPEPFLGFVEVPAGHFVMGSRKGEKDANDRELGNPPQLEMPYRYWIGRYPVTVAQCAAFIREEGYESECYWSANGFSWRLGQYDTTVEHKRTCANGWRVAPQHCAGNPCGGTSSGVSQTARSSACAGSRPWPTPHGSTAGSRMRARFTRAMRCACRLRPSGKRRPARVTGAATRGASRTGARNAQTSMKLALGILRRLASTRLARHPRAVWTSRAMSGSGREACTGTTLIEQTMERTLRMRQYHTCCGAVPGATVGGARVVRTAS